MKPERSISDFVESFWFLQNQSDQEKEVIILPDGRIDLFFSKSSVEPFYIILMGIGTQPDKAIIKPGTLTFAVSFKLLATEFIFRDKIANLVDKALTMADNFWDFSEMDLQDFDFFCKKISDKIKELIPEEVDERKQKLFDLIYSSNGTITVQDLSDKVTWSSRQINRYFNQQYGIALKSYCNILRFRASFQHIKNGELYPQLNFSDQSHFIKEIKKLSGVLPKELKINQNDRFIQFSTLSKK